MQRIKYILFRLLLNNFLVNSLIRLFGLERWVYARSNPYLSFTASNKGSTQENAGYSNRPEINEVITRSKSDLLAAVDQNCTAGASILDIGCGPGMYLSLLSERNYRLTATDINQSMIDKARQLVPDAVFKTGDFLGTEFDHKFDFIYCIGVLVYVPRCQLNQFINKIHGLLKDGGILYLNYPHAISWLDVVYNDLTYIQYSPKTIESMLTDKFEVIRHEHAFDGRKIGRFDHSPYKSLNPYTNRTYKNSYLLIAKKIH